MWKIGIHGWIPSDLGCLEVTSKFFFWTKGVVFMWQTPRQQFWSPCIEYNNVSVLKFGPFLSSNPFIPPRKNWSLMLYALKLRHLKAKEMFLPPEAPQIYSIKDQWKQSLRYKDWFSTSPGKTRFFSLVLYITLQKISVGLLVPWPQPKTVNAKSMTPRKTHCVLVTTPAVPCLSQTP